MDMIVCDMKEQFSIPTGRTLTKSGKIADDLIYAVLDDANGSSIVLLFNGFDTA